MILKTKTTALGWLGREQIVRQYFCFIAVLCASVEGIFNG